MPIRHVHSGDGCSPPIVEPRRAAAVGLPEWIGRWLVPIVLVVVGAYVLLTGWIAT